MRRLILSCVACLLVLAPAVANAMSADAAAKVDPRLILVYRNPARFAHRLADVVNLDGPSVDELVVPVLVKTRAPDVEFRALDAQIGWRQGDILALRLPLERLDDLASLATVEAVEASYRLENLLDHSVPECGGEAVHGGYPPYTGTGVIVGILDTGIDPLHGDFLDAYGTTRVLYIWDQYGDETAPPSGFSYGCEWTKAQIDAGQCSMADPGAHGSHVAGIAAGDGSSSSSDYHGMAPDAKLVVVKNQGEAMFTYGFAPPWYDSPSSVGIIDGLGYLHAKSQSLNMPLVINISQGVTMGPHDGSTLFEQAMGSFIRNTGVPVVLSAGNYQTADMHARGTITAGTPEEITFYTGADQTDVRFEVWYARGDLLSLEIASPGGAGGIAYGPNETDWSWHETATGDTVWVYSIGDHPISHKGYFLVYLQDRGEGTTITSGTWTIWLSAHNSLPQGGEADLWFERNRDAYFLDHISYETTVGMPACTREAITVGAYTTNTQWVDIDDNWNYTSGTVGDIASFSSTGPTADGRHKPDLSAPGHIICSVLSGGSAQDYYDNDRTKVAWDGVHLLLSGTSMAAPHVTGAVALMLQKNPNLGAERIKQILMETARHDEYAEAGWSSAFGWGKLDARASVDATGDPGEVALIYDDGEPYSGYYWDEYGGQSGVRMTSPHYPADVLRVSYYIRTIDYLGDGDGSFTARILDFQGGQPGSVLLSIPVTPWRTGWNEITLPGSGVRVTRDFVVGMWYDGVNTPSYGYDQDDNSRSWDFYPAQQSWALSGETFFMRATVSTGLDAEESATLAGLSAGLRDGYALLTWENHEGFGIIGYNVLRASGHGFAGADRLNTALIQCTQFADETIEPGTSYHYWLETVAGSGVETRYGPVDLTIPGGPATVWLLAPRPSPSQGPTDFRFFVPAQGVASLSLHDLAGREVATVASRVPLHRGWRTVAWSPQASSLRSGSYVCRLRFDADGISAADSRPVILIR